MNSYRSADVAVMSGVPVVLTYSVPSDMEALIGSRVLVPLRTNERIGVVVSMKDNVNDDPSLKPIRKVLDDRPLIPKELVDLLLWTSRYYHSR
ncbi:hypothetical protein EG833_05080, partial [archaeon]|nr:hypothetical protein [archaeon]